MEELRRPALKAEAFVGVTKVARDLRLGQRTLRPATQSGELPTYVFGQRARLKVSDVRRWIESHRRRP